MSQLNESVLEVELTEPPPAKSFGRLLFSGSSALGIATILERGLGFIANIAAARLGGAHVFGAYSIAMTTANNVASYAGAGIGTTANRFSGEYPYGTPGYKGLLRTLAIVCLSSAALAILVLWFAAQPLAVRLIRNPSLTHLLQLASISAGAIILLECFRGLLIGQRRFKALFALSALFGSGMVLMLPLASHFGASQMVMTQAAIAFSAILLCVLAAKKLQLAPQSKDSFSTTKEGPKAGSILRFGMVQLAGMVGLNAAGWWVASLVARADSSLIQAGWFSVAMQLRNMCAMPASLISQTAYAQMTESGGEGFGGAGRVTILSTLASTLISQAVATPIAAFMPWIVSGIYGKEFVGAELAATLAVATGLVHMSNAPAAARLTVVSLPSTGVINGFWSILLFALGSWFVPTGGAAQAAACFLAAHLFSALAVLLGLLRFRAASVEVLNVNMPALAGSLVIAVLAWLRAASTHKLEMSALMFAAMAGLTYLSLYQARKASPAIRDLSLSKLTQAVLSRGTSFLQTHRVKR